MSKDVKWLLRVQWSPFVLWAFCPWYGAVVGGQVLGKIQIFKRKSRYSVERDREREMFADFLLRVETDGDWIAWVYQMPPQYDAVEALSPYWGEPLVIRRADLRPEANIANLYWRPLP